MAARQDTRSLENQSVGLGAGTSGREARNAVTSKEDSIIKTSVKERALHKDECLYPIPTVTAIPPAILYRSI